MSVTTHCLVTVEYRDGSVRIRHWTGKRGAERLLAAIRARYAVDPTVAHFTPGNTWGANNYGAH